MEVLLWNLLENFKTDILGTLSSQIDSMNIKNKFEDEALTIFGSRCKKRLPLKNFPLNVVSLCGLCVEKHEIDSCPALPGLQAIYSQHTPNHMCYYFSIPLEGMSKLHTNSFVRYHLHRIFFSLVMLE